MKIQQTWGDLVFLGTKLDKECSIPLVLALVDGLTPTPPTPPTPPPLTLRKCANRHGGHRHSWRTLGGRCGTGQGTLSGTQRADCGRGIEEGECRYLVVVLTIVQIKEAQCISGSVVGAV